MLELSKQVETRVIQVFFNGEAINIATNADKWSEIVPLIENNENGFSLTGKKAVLGSTKGVLQLPDALIPPGNQAVFLVQDKMKSGAEKPFEDIAYVDLRRLAKDKGITGLGSSPKREDLINALKSATGLKELKGNSKAVKEKKAEVITKTKEKVIELNPNLEERVIALEKMLGDTIEGFGSILDSLRGKGKIVQKQTFEAPKKIESENAFGQGTNKIKTEAELQVEFNNLKLK